MKTLSFPKSNSILREVIEVEAELRNNRIALAECEERLEDMDRNDPMRIESLKKATTFKLSLAKDETSLAVLKAKAGIVGHSWYNGYGDNRGDAS